MPLEVSDPTQTPAKRTARLLRLFWPVFAWGRITRSIRLGEHRHGYRRMPAVLLIGAFLVSWTGMLVVMVAEEGSFHEDTLIVGLPVVAAATAWGCLLVWGGILVSAALFGRVMSVRHKRNLLPAAAQAAAYVCPFVVTGYAIVWGVVMGLALLDEAYDLLKVLERWLDLPRGALPAVTILGSIGLLLILMQIMIWRMIYHARYANR